MRKWLVLSLCVLILGGGLCLLFANRLTNSNRETNISLRFPPKLNERLLLFHGNQDQRIRKMVYAEDGFTPLHAETSFENGDTGRIVFRPDFTASEILRFFANSTGQEPVLKSRFVIGSDGRKILSVREYDKDSRILLEGDRVEDDNYREKTYFPGTTNLSRNRLLMPRTMVLGGIQFNPVYVLHEVGYYPSTAQKYVYRKIDTVTFERTSYFESGALESYDHREGRKQDGFILWENSRKRVSYKKVSRSDNPWSVEWVVESESADRDGVVYDRRIFGYNYIKVKVETPMHSLIQDWRLTDSKVTGAARLDIKNYTLTSINLPLFNGWKNVSILLQKDGKTVKEVWHNYMDGDVQINVFLDIRADGTIAKKRVVNTRTLKPEEVEYEADKGGKVIVPPEFFNPSTRYEFPVAIPDSPDVYGWYP